MQDLAHYPHLVPWQVGIRGRCPRCGEGHLFEGFLKLAPKYLSASATPGLRDELRMIVDRAHLRGLAVIAPRVEDAQSAATLWMSGIDYIQGNLVQLTTRELDFDFQAAVL